MGVGEVHGSVGFQEGNLAKPEDFIGSSQASCVMDGGQFWGRAMRDTGNLKMLAYLQPGGTVDQASLEKLVEYYVAPVRMARACGLR